MQSFEDLGRRPPPDRAGRTRADLVVIFLLLASLKLVDVAAEVGVTLVNVSGETDKQYVVEVNGNGAAFFDYDGHAVACATGLAVLRAILDEDLLANVRRMGDALAERRVGGKARLGSYASARRSSITCRGLRSARYRSPTDP